MSSKNVDILWCPNNHFDIYWEKNEKYDKYLHPRVSLKSKWH